MLLLSNARRRRRDSRGRSSWLRAAAWAVLSDQSRGLCMAERASARKFGVGLAAQSTDVIATKHTFRGRRSSSVDWAGGAAVARAEKMLLAVMRAVMGVRGREDSLARGKRSGRWLVMMGMGGEGFCFCSLAGRQLLVRSSMDGPHLRSPALQASQL